MEITRPSGMPTTTVLNFKNISIEQIENKKNTLDSKNNNKGIENSILNSLFSDSGINNSIPNLAQPKNTYNSTTVATQLALMEDIKAEQPEKSQDSALSKTSNNQGIANTNKFDITQHVDGRIARVIEIMFIILEAQLNDHKNMSMQREANRQVSYAQGQYAADKKIQAGIDGKQMAITRGAVGGIVSVAGGATSIRGLSNANKAHMDTGNEINKLKVDIRDIQKELTDGNNLLTPEKMAKLKEEHKFKFDKIAINETQMARDLNNAQKRQVIGSMGTANSNNLAEISSAQGQVARATSQADEQKATTNQNMYSSRTDSEDRMAEASLQRILELLQSLTRLMENHTNTASVIISNSKPG